MKLSRVREAGMDELRFRTRQELWKFFERAAWNLRGSRSFRAPWKAPARNSNGLYLRGLFDAGDSVPEKETPFDAFRRKGPNRFFAGVSDDVAGTIAAEMPEFRSAVSEREASLRQGRFDLLGYRDLDFSTPVDWHFDPVSGRRSPLTHWSQIDPLDAETVGDSKVIWEVNRQQWLLQLGQAYRWTHDEDLARRFVECVTDWTKKNPPGIGINWSSSLEVALRIVAWSWALFFFAPSKALTKGFFSSILRQIALHAAHVEKYLSLYFSPNTHLTGEALGLFYTGVMFPELKSAQRWRRLGAEILIRESTRQILPDGVYFEQSTCYERYTVEIYLHFLILARRNHLDIPAGMEEKVAAMVDFLLSLCASGGFTPQIGDTDGGWLLPFTRRASNDLRGVLSTAAVLFGRPEYARVAGCVAPETLWLLGESAGPSFRRLAARPAAKKGSRVFPQGGYAVMRSGEADAHQLVFDFGPLGCPVSGAHGHADLLSLQCTAFGEPYVVDPGTYRYAPESDWRNFFRSTRAHSTVLVDGQEQAIPSGPFKWHSRPQGRLLHWASTESYDFADAEHHAYHGLRDPVTHRRRIVFVKPKYWLVIDDLGGKWQHRLELRFQFAALDVRLERSFWCRARGSRGSALLLRPFARVPLTAELARGKLFPIQGWVSADYGRREPAPALIYSTSTRLPLRIFTLLYPVESFGAPRPEVGPIFDADQALTGLIFKDSAECIRVREDEVILQRQGAEENLSARP